MSKNRNKPAFRTRRLPTAVPGLVLMLLGWFLSQPVLAGPAMNQFEVKDLDVEVRRWEFQSQNAWSWAQPDRRFVEEAPGEVEFDDNSVARQRYALELEFGVTERFRSRFGIEIEQGRVDDPDTVSNRNDFDSLELEELALEGVFVLVPVGRNGIGLGLLGEYQYTLDTAEADSLVFGPIVEAVGERWSLVFNPALVQFLNAPGDDNKLDFSYALQLACEVSESWIMAIEAYGALDRLGSSGKPGDDQTLFGDHDQHRLGPIAYLQRDFGHGGPAAELSIGLGVFIGLNEHTPDGTFKLSIEYEF